MYIPEILKVKISDRGTLNNIPLSYITYIDEHKKLRNEKSWTNWSKTILPDVVNEPLKGFKIFDDVTRRSSYFGSGRTMFNVCHPKGFYFEISSNNLAELVCRCTVINGVIQDECVLSWDKTSLAILPATSSEYKENIKHTEMINDGTVKIADLKIGHAYCDRNRNPAGYYAGTFKVINFDINEKYRGGYSYHSTRNFEYECKASCRILHVFVDGGRYKSVNAIANPKVFVDANLLPDMTKIHYEESKILNRRMIKFPEHLKTVDEVKEFIMNNPLIENKLENKHCVGGFINYGFSTIKKMLRK